MTVDWHSGDKIPDPSTGRARWEIQRILHGGMGIVYIVYDPKRREAFAAKTFLDKIFVHRPQIAERFREEARAWINLNAHQNVVQAHFIEIIEDKPFLFLEYVSGGDLSNWIGTRRLIGNLPQVLRFAIQFCDGMIYALSKDIIAHCDIKPANCLITEGGTLKVADFGLARVVASAKRTEGVGGSPPYMPPEQFDQFGQVDERSDIYSFGVMLFQMVTGRLPFVGRTWQEFMHLHKTQPPPALGSQHRELGAVIQTCLAKDPARRFADFGTVRERLAKIYERVTGRRAPRPISGIDLDAAQLTNKAVSLFNLGRTEEAFACLERALALNPRFSPAWLYKGMLHQKMHEPETSLACTDRGLEINPFDARGWHNKGVAFHMLGQHEEALGCYDHALKLDPFLERTWHNKGAELEILGRYEEALICYDRALELNPQAVLSADRKIRCLIRLQRYEEARAFFDSFMRGLGPDPHIGAFLSRRALGLTDETFQIWLKGFLESTIALCKAALEDNPRSVETWNLQGDALLITGHYEEALTCYDRALELDPRSGEAWLGKAGALKDLKRYEEALLCINRALEIKPHDAGVWTNKGLLLGEKLGKWREAIARYKRALKIDPHFEVAWLNIGNALCALGQYEEALKCYDQALELDPHDIKVLFNKGAALVNGFRRYLEALGFFEEAQRLGHPRAEQAIALCRQKLDR